MLLHAVLGARERANLLLLHSRREAARRRLLLQQRLLLLVLHHLLLGVARERVQLHLREERARGRLQRCRAVRAQALLLRERAG